VRRLPYATALKSADHAPAGFRAALRARTSNVVDVQVIRDSGVAWPSTRWAARPALLGPINSIYGLDVQS
jgi:hypothetical protein